MLARVKKLKDKKASGVENEMTNLFLVSAGYEAINKIPIMVYPKILEDLEYEEISATIKRNIYPKQNPVIAERTKFLENRQNPNETVLQYLHRLKEVTTYGEFEKLDLRQMAIEDLLILLRLNESMNNVTYYHKILGGVLVV